MKRTIISALAGMGALLCVSCATAVRNTSSTLPAATIDLGSLERGQYSILGHVTGESSVTVKTSDLSKEAKNAYQTTPQQLNIKLDGDTQKYGFIGAQPAGELSVLQRAEAMATYNMIENAKHAGADAVLYVQRQQEVTPNGGKTTIHTTVSGFAVTIKAESGALPSVSVPAAPAPSAAPVSVAPRAAEQQAPRTAAVSTSSVAAAVEAPAASRAPQASAVTAQPVAAATPVVETTPAAVPAEPVPAAAEAEEAIVPVYYDEETE